MRVGEDLALILDASTWKASGIEGDTELEVDIDESGIHIRPSSPVHPDQVMESARRMLEIHQETFRKLAQ